MSRTLPLFANVGAATYRKVASGGLNNTTPLVTFSVNNSGNQSFLIGDTIAVWDNTTYPNAPSDDPNARLGKVTARSNVSVTVQFGLYDTPIVAITGRPTIALAFRGDSTTGGSAVLEQTADLGNQNSVTRTANFTLALADSGTAQVIDTDAIVATIPTSAPGLTFDFIVGGTDDAVGAIGFAISPQAADAIDGGGATGVNNKDVLITKATAKKGDRIRLVGGATNKYVISYLGAAITREA